MKKVKSKDPVRLRRRKTPTGNISLYLDIYIDGKRTYEYPRLYLIPEKTREDREKNRETLALAEAIRAKRLVELRNGTYGFRDEFMEDTLFFDYYCAMCEKRHGNLESRGNWGNWYSCLKHLREYEKNQKITFAEITPKWVQGFHDYLDRQAHAWSCDARDRNKEEPLSQNTKQSYFNKLRACINQAYEERIIRTNPLRGIEGFKGAEGERMYLTIEEIRKLVDTPCDYPAVKDAFLFSCLTGLRRSDIVKMTWKEVQKQGEFTRIIFRQKKTGGQEYLDISPQAVALMGERRGPDDMVFGYILTPDATNKALRMWVLRAGIDKKITFHCGRHTFATMMLDLGTDIYTVSKLLGHADISTTQIYAKVMDKNKQAAVAAIPDFMKVASSGEHLSPSGEEPVG